ncbi:MAG TPA: glycoside hydrolase family 3 N-terminal domain-containing protein [Geminicoccaceae bacterium]
MPEPQAGARIEALLEAMTLEEKIGQLTLVSAGWAVTGPQVSVDYMAALRAGRIGAISNLWGAEETRAVQRVAVEETRLGIPLLFAFDVVHGHRTIFPIPLGEAAAFDPVLWERTARAAAIEAAADGLNLTFAPMLDVARDPRWGRIAESPGEDPWVAARFAEAKVRGFEGDDIAHPQNLAATAKHLAAYGASVAGRDYAAVDISEWSFHEVYLPPFRAAVAAGVAAIMPAFTDLTGVPMTANAAILRGLVRERWRFDGVIVSDHGAIAELIAHGVAEDEAEAAALALRAGVDIDLMGGTYGRGLPIALERGLVTVGQIDAAVRRVLRLKARLGLFDDPYHRSDAALAPPGQAEVHRELARDAARRSIVLLTNRDGLLPLQDGEQRIAVIGPLAVARDDMLGPWAAAGRAEDMVTILEGLRHALPHSEVGHAPGVAIEGDEVGSIGAALDLARAADVVVLCLGEARRMSGEAASRARPDLPGRQPELAQAVLDLGKPVVALLSSGRPLMAPWLFERAQAVLATWFLGSEAGHAIGEVVSGQYNPAGRLPVSWPLEVGQIPVFYARRPSGRPAHPEVHYSSKYLDLPVEPLFPFGHGLSYSRFVPGDLRVSAAELVPGQELSVELEVTNEGPRAGEVTMFLFIRDPVAAVSRPLLELKGISKAVLDPGASTALSFSLTTDDLRFLGPDLSPRLESGLIELFVGASANREDLLRAEIHLVVAS